jgi:hypothetical protein
MGKLRVGEGVFNWSWGGGPGGRGWFVRRGGGVVVGWGFTWDRGYVDERVVNVWKPLLGGDAGAILAGKADSTALGVQPFGEYSVDQEAVGGLHLEHVRELGGLPPRKRYVVEVS